MKGRLIQGLLLFCLITVVLVRNRSKDEASQTPLRDYVLLETRKDRLLIALENARCNDLGQVLVCLDNLAQFYLQLGVDTEAQPYLEEILTLNPNASTRCRVLAQLSRALARSSCPSDRQRALNLLQASKEIDVTALNTYLAGLFAMGQSPSSGRESLLQSAHLSKTAAEEGRAYNGLGLLYHHSGEIIRAEEHYLRGKECLATSPTVERALNFSNLASFYTDMGQFERAAKSYVDAIRALEALEIPHLRHLLILHQNHAELLLQLEKPNRAIHSLEDCVRVADVMRLVGDGNATKLLATLRANLGSAYQMVGDRNNAKTSFDEALVLAEEMSDHLLVARAHNNKAGLYREIGEADKARRHYECSHAIYIEDVGLPDSHPELSNIRHNLAFLEIEENGLTAQARDLVQKTTAGSRAYFRKVLLFGDEARRLAFLSRQSPFDLLAFANMTEELAAAVVQTKRAILDSLIEDARLLKQHQHDPRLGEFYQSRQVLWGAEDAGQGSRELESAIVSRYHDLLGQSSRRALEVTPAQVAEAIPCSAALVEYFAYQEYLGDGKWRPAYGCIVLGKDFGPVVIDCGGAEEIEPLIRTCQTYCGTRTGEGSFLKANEALYRYLIEPVKAVLPSDCRWLIVSPDHQLNFVSFATLIAPGDPMDCLLDEFDVSYVATGRDLIERSQSSVPNRTLTAISTPMFLSEAPLESGQLADGAPRIPGALNFLPFTGANRIKHSVEAICQKAGLAGWQTTTLEGRDADEQAVCSLESPGILHFATHGAAWTSDHSPMGSCGLALSGAQTTITQWRDYDRVPPIAGDGLLLGFEIANLSLEHTALVTLAACDTALGLPFRSEGVLGLRRAFAQAGAKNLVMTLWEVPVIETSRFMEDFYSELMRTPQVVRSLVATQRRLLSEYRTKHGLAEAIRKVGAFMVITHDGPHGNL